MDTNVHTVSVNGHRVKVQLRDIIWFITTSIAVVGIYFAATNKMDKNSGSIAAAAEDRLKIWTTLNYMNEHGTTHSHLVDEKQQQSIDLLGSDYADLNRQLRELGPQVQRIDANVLWLMSREVEKKTQERK